MKAGILTVAATLLFGSVFMQGDRRAVSVDEGRVLVRALLADGWTKLPGFAIEDYPSESKRRPYSPSFYIIHATYSNPGGGSTIGHYAIDLENGDVWDWVVCARYTSPSLAKAQRSLRQRIGLNDDEYPKRRRNAPWCGPSQEPGVLEMGRPMF